MKKTRLFAANWKMNKKASEIAPFVRELSQKISGIDGVEIAVAPIMAHLPLLAASLQGTSLRLAAQNAGPAASGAFTGEVSGSQLKEIGVTYALIGHSERRHVFHEGKELLAKRLTAALEAGLSVIYCVGETLQERKAGATRKVVEEQLELLKGRPTEALVVAYEPVWAIGTGENATPEQAEEVHGWIAEWLERQLKSSSIRILYGGSVKPDNAAGLMARKNVDGLLIGGASLEAQGFADIIRHGSKG